VLLMVIEQFRDKDQVRARFESEGRMLPHGVSFLASWIDPKTQRCFQLMESESTAALDPWIARWQDLVEFEVVPVLASEEYWATCDSKPHEV
jgi:hypothetical protein